MNSFQTNFSLVWNMSHVIAVHLEEKSRKRNLLGTTIRLILTKALSNRFIGPFKFIVFNPLTLVLIVLVLYLVFCFIYVPLLLLSYLVTSWGSFAILLFCIILGARAFARTMTFPGSSASLPREISIEFIRRLSTQIENISIVIVNYTSTTLMILSGKIQRFDGNIMINRYEALMQAVTSFGLIQSSMKQCYEVFLTDLNRNNVELKLSDRENINQFLEQLDSFLSRYQRLHSHLLIFYETLLSIRQNNPNNYTNSDSNYLLINNISNLISHDEQKQLLYHGTQLLQHFDTFKLFCTKLRPSQNGPRDQDNIINFIWSNLFSLNQGPTGVNLLVLPFMRIQLKNLFNSEEVRLVGAQGHSIDAVFIPAGSTSESALNRQTKPSHSETSTSKGIILFCSPNAGLYECLSQGYGQSSGWHNYYLSLGFDIFYYNYRGYGRSTGVPTPNRLKMDAEIVIKYLKNERGYKNIIVHGESLGGMIACSLAKNNRINLLVCDRTFASLDAVAHRMLGAWAGVGLRYLGQWYTNVTEDFLDADCRKVVFQDTNDEIISYPSSLRSGVACYMLLRSATGAVYTLPRDYAIAIAYAQLELRENSSKSCHESCRNHFRLYLEPRIERLNILLQRHAINPSPHTHPITEEFIAYFYTCISMLHTQYKAIMLTKLKNKKKCKHNGNISVQSAPSGSAYSSGLSPAKRSATHSPPHVSEKSLKDTNSENRQTTDLNPAASSAATQLMHTLSSPSPQSSFKHAPPREHAKQYSVATADVNSPKELRTSANTTETESSLLRTLQRTNAYQPDSDDDDSYQKTTATADEVDDDTLNELDSTLLRSIDSANAENSLNSITSNGRNRSFLLHDPYLHPIEKLWCILIQIDFNLGHLLGNAFARGFDTFRVWVCNSVVWSERCACQLVNSFQATQQCSEMSATATGIGQPSLVPIYITSSMSLAQYIEAFEIIYNAYKNEYNGDTEGYVQFILDALLIMKETIATTKLYSGYSNKLVTSSHSTSYITSLCSKPTTSSSLSERISASTSYHGQIDQSPLKNSSQYPYTPVYSDYDIEVAALTSIDSVTRQLDSGPNNGNKTSVTPKDHGRGEVGKTITLFTGHSGWPGEFELNELKNEIRNAGFNI